MSESAYRARQKYEISRKKKAVSFNVDRPYEAKLFDFAARLSDFSGWVKENLAEEQSLRISGKPLLTFDNTADSRLLNTDFWRSRYARYGFPFLSVCNDVLRLLVPSRRREAWSAGILAGKQLIITSPAHSGNPDYTDLIFDDGSPLPFCLTLDTIQHEQLPAVARYCLVYGAGQIIAELSCSMHVNAPKR